MWQAVFDALKAAWDWLVGLLVGFGQSVISTVMSFMPDSVQNGLEGQSSVIGFALSAANAWAPIDLAISLAGMWIVFTLSYLAIKALVKLIP